MHRGVQSRVRLPLADFSASAFDRGRRDVLSEIHIVQVNPLVRDPARTIFLFSASQAFFQSSSRSVCLSIYVFSLLLLSTIGETRKTAEQLTDLTLIRSKKREPDATRRYYISDLISRICHYVPLLRRTLIPHLRINANRAECGIYRRLTSYTLPHYRSERDLFFFYLVANADNRG